MAEPERPLGLSFLAVLSFGLALFNVFSAVNLVLLVLGKLTLPSEPGMLAAYHALAPWLRSFLLVASIAKAALLVGAGVAYFARRRAGRLLGSAYGVLSIAESVLVASLYGVHGDSVVGVLFAAYTLVAVNTMFKAHLTR
jgi:hypothetical protein